jgi:hypothetical protein
MDDALAETTIFGGIALCHRKQAWLEYEPVTDHADRLPLPWTIFAAKPPFSAFPVCDLRRVLTEHHPVKTFFPCVWAIVHPYSSENW